MNAKSSPAGWSRLNVAMHWLIVVLIIVQYLESEFMVSLWDGTLEGKAVSSTTTILGWTHIVLGSAILVAASIRLLDRFFIHGRPSHSEGEPDWAMWLAKFTHALLYVVLILMPVVGLTAWFTGNDTLAGYHTVLWTPLLVLIGVHIAGALAQHFVFRSDALRRMVPMMKSPSSVESAE
ncbi:cytochrome b [Aurantimonas sp. A3-2-R12]|uniref:cytochrome b n=1 Tax=Aurantimonas sp. A3-2-R12 TaxID=3114362 RepID=UPI002E177F2F|nr:cytochrome b/b6 domain-containing protein [Aurantimonas sp. A3-2-R12]